MGQRTGAVESTFLRFIGRSARVQAVERVGEQFRLVTLRGDDLVGAKWSPGDMIQVSFGGWESRAYTPLSYDAVSGALAFLGYVHRNGMGSAWLESLCAEDTCQFVGPVRQLTSRLRHAP